MASDRLAPTATIAAVAGSWRQSPAASIDCGIHGTGSHSLPKSPTSTSSRTEPVTPAATPARPGIRSVGTRWKPLRSKADSAASRR